MKIFVVNIRESTERLEQCRAVLESHGVSESDIKVVHPLMVRDFDSQDDWCDVAGVPFSGLKGREPFVQISFLHTYLRILGEIEAFENDGDFGLILEDDILLNMDIGEVEGYLDTALELHPSTFFFVQLACWGNTKDGKKLLSAERVLETPFYYFALNGTKANVANRVSASVLKTLLWREIPSRLETDSKFALDLYIHEIAGEYDFCAVEKDSELFVIDDKAPSEYLTPGGEYTVRKEFERNENGNASV